eukprot:gene7816-4344_t
MGECLFEPVHSEFHAEAKGVATLPNRNYRPRRVRAAVPNTRSAEGGLRQLRREDDDAGAAASQKDKRAAGAAGAAAARRETKQEPAAKWAAKPAPKQGGRGRAAGAA